MYVKWEGVKKIITETKNTLKFVENISGYDVYTALPGHTLILSGVAIVPRTWQFTIRTLCIPKTGRTDRFFYQGFREGEGSIITESEEPVLELKEE